MNSELRKYIIENVFDNVKYEYKKINYEDLAKNNWAIKNILNMVNNRILYVCNNEKILKEENIKILKAVFEKIKAVKVL